MDESSDVQVVMTKLQEANKLMESLIDLSLSDERISTDEKDLLFSINDNLTKYAELIIDTLKDKKVDDDEKTKMANLEEKIVTDAKNIANQDDVVTEEEKDLLQNLATKITEISEM